MTEYKIKDDFLENIRRGLKEREYRLNDERAQRISVGEKMRLVSNKRDSKYITVKVVQKKVFRTWREALSAYWKNDFQALYSSMEEALNQLKAFYSDEDVQKFGIVVFRITPVNINFQGKRVLLDSEIVMLDNNQKNTSIMVKQTYDYLEQFKCELFCFQDVKIISERKYTRLKETMTCLNQNDNNEKKISFLLKTILKKVDFIITNNFNLLEISGKMRLLENVITIDEFLNSAEKNNFPLVNYKMLSIGIQKMGELDINDSFFDSLKSDYGEKEFTEWFLKKSDSLAYIFKDKYNVLRGLLYLKIENCDENYSEICPVLPPKRRLKIGTFKTAASGFHIGERFLRIAIDNALNANVDEIYATLFENKRKEVKGLEILLKKWGFKKWGEKNNGETVLVKDMKKYQDSKDPRFNYPLEKKSPNYFFLPIEAAYHTDLFPDSILRNENAALFEGEIGHRYSIEKVYVSNALESSKRVQPGDIVLIYRKGEKSPKKYSSVVTGEAIVQSIHYPMDLQTYLSLCKDKSIFSEETLKYFYSNKQYHLVVKILDYKHFPKKILLNDLQDYQIIKEGEGPRPFSPLSKSNYGKICKLAELEDGK